MDSLVDRIGAREGMLRRSIGAWLAMVLVAGCGVFAPASGLDGLGVSASVGGWTVTVTTPDPKTDFGQTLAGVADVFFEAAGATPATGTWATYRMTDGRGFFMSVDGYRVNGAVPEAMWRGAQGISIEGTSPVVITAGGWDLRHWGDEKAWVAVRGDRLFTLPGGPLGPTLEQVRTFLDGLA